jgi:hypothetical protein
VNRPNQADLVGYSLGALDDDQHQQVQRALDTQPELRAKLERLESTLAGLPEPVVEQTPVGLGRRTCDLVASLDCPADRSLAGRDMVTLRPDWRFSTLRTGWRAVDVFVAASVCVLIALIFLPAIANSRFQADLYACQNNLREIGVGLANYADTYPGKLVPIPVSDRYGIAGIYASGLRDLELVSDESVFFCRSSSTRPADRHIPSLEEIWNAQGEQAFELRRRSGGDYAYTLGYVENGRYCPPQINDASAFQVILADDPDASAPGYRSANHSGRGQNVLLGDFATKYILNCMVSPGDNIYQNNNGMIAPGTSRSDSVLGSGATSVFPFVPANK